MQREVWLDCRDWIFCALLTLLAFGIFIAAQARALSFLHNLVTFDGYFYLSIAKHGYAFSGNLHDKQNVSFLPLEAGAIALFRWLLPGRNDFLKIAILGALVLFGILVGFCALLRVRYGRHAAWMAGLLWALSPMALYHFVGYTEPLFALATVWCLVALERRRLWTASVIAGLAVLGRPQAVVLVLFVGAELLRQANWRPWRLFDAGTMVKLVLLVFPIMAYASWMAWRFGDSMLYANSMVAWNNGTAVGQFLPFWKAVPYFFHMVSDGSPALTQWTTLLAGMTWLVLLIALAFAPAAPPRAACMYVAFLLFLAFTTAFDVANVARHVFYFAPWAIILGVALARLPGAAWAKYVAVTPLLLIWIVINTEAITRFYHGLWVS
ncbi:MAG: hypothetical protein OJF55_001892 [Rhodanobacteraceae bacterium]|nr:MAG: hypothetical protein OJF55_001892 [Rhodanobacteraceae bacterium]